MNEKEVENSNSSSNKKSNSKDEEVNASGAPLKEPSNTIVNQKLSKLPRPEKANRFP